MCKDKLYLYTLVMKSPKWKLRKQFHLLHTMEYYSDIKRNETGPFVEMCMDLETVKQHEVSQKEKNKYWKITHIHGIQKNGIDDLICKAEIQTQRQKTNAWITRGKGVGQEELGDWDCLRYSTLLTGSIKLTSDGTRLHGTGNFT